MSLHLKGTGLPIAMLALILAGRLPIQALGQQAVAPAQHDANFEQERASANELYAAGKVLESLPLYEDLCRQDPKSPLFAERHGSALLAKAATISDASAKQAVFNQAIAEIVRAKSLGDNSPYVQNILDNQRKSQPSGGMPGVPLTVGYTYNGSAQAQAVFQEAEAAFGKNDVDGAVKLYQQAARLDPTWYAPAVYAGDMYFRKHDPANAGAWFQKAIVIDPDRDTAYRYWGDALYNGGDSAGAKVKYEQALVAEPYAKPALNSLVQWVRETKTAIRPVQIQRPEFSAPGGKLQIDAALNNESGDGHTAWLTYENCRVAHGAESLSQRTLAGTTDASGHFAPSGYRHSLAEETECLNLMLAEVEKRLSAGSLTAEKLEPSLATLLQLKKDGMVACWILLSGADAGIRVDYAGYRKEHRELLVTYVDRYILRPSAPA